ncbi:MAG TPA: 30S ribosomal protein S6 [Opitutaceae bacterium]|nr:30S ribosomal protein S6 [Opitutaceae bacterium]
MTQTKRKYKATFIIDTRGREESLDQLLEKVKQDIAAVQGEVVSVENLGQRDLARSTDPKFVAAPYVQMEFLAPVDGPKHLHERLRLNQVVYRAMFEKI